MEDNLGDNCFTHSTIDCLSIFFFINNRNIRSSVRVTFYVCSFWNCYFASEAKL